MTPASPETTAQLITALRDDAGQRFRRLTLRFAALAAPADVTAASAWTGAEERAACLHALDRANRDAVNVEAICRRITTACALVAYAERTSGVLYVNP